MGKDNTTQNDDNIHLYNSMMTKLKMNILDDTFKETICRKDMLGNVCSTPTTTTLCVATANFGKGWDKVGPEEGKGDVSVTRTSQSTQSSRKETPNWQSQ